VVSRRGPQLRSRPCCRSSLAVLALLGLPGLGLGAGCEPGPAPDDLSPDDAAVGWSDVDGPDLEIRDAAAGGDLGPAPADAARIPDLAADTGTDPGDAVVPQCPAAGADRPEGSSCRVAGASGVWRCLAGELRCQAAPPPATLCGEAEGLLVGGEAPYRLGCPLTVPAGRLLELGAGVQLELGPHPLRVLGELRGEAATFRRVDGVGLEVLAGGRLQLSGSLLVVGEGQADALVLARSGSSVRLEDVRFRDLLGRGVGVLAEGQAAPELLAPTFTGLWVGVRARDASRPRVDRARFFACSTGLLADARSRPVVQRSRFVGDGFHLWLHPDALAELSSGLASDSFAGGVPLTLAGTLQGDVRVPLAADLLAVSLVDVRVAPLGTLRLAPGLTVTLPGPPLEVEGRLEAEGVVFSGLQSTAIRFRPGAGGRLVRSLFFGEGPGEGSLLALERSPVEVRECLFSAAAAGWEGVTLTGQSAGGQAAHLIANTFEGLPVGVRLAAGAAPRLEGNTFSECAVGLDVGADAGPFVMKDNGFHGAGVHVGLTPDFFALTGVGARVWASGNRFDEAGIPFWLAGVVAAPIRLFSPQAIPLTLGPLRVDPTGSLEAGAPADLRLLVRQGDSPLTVAGQVTLRNLELAGARGTALDLLPGARGLLAGVSLVAHGDSPLPLVGIRDCSPELREVVFRGAGTRPLGLAIAGSDAQAPAAPLVHGCFFDGVQVGISLDGAAAPRLEENLFATGVVPVCPGAPGCP